MSRQNDIPLLRPPTHRGYGDAYHSPSPGYGQRRWDHRPVFQDNTRFAAPTEYRPFEESLAIRPFSLASMPLEPYPLPTRVIVFNNNMGRGINHRPPQSPHQLTPRLLGQGNMHVPTRADESKLTKEEQELVLKKLKKDIYNPMPKAKILARRVSLYYRDLNKDPSNKAVDKHRSDDEDGKSCAVCLEDFEPREEVMLTPCNHMFHEECIVPWVKNHGQCPVCRSALCERMKDNGSALNNNSSNNNNRGAILPARNDMFAGELISLIQAVDEAFPWGI